MSYRRLEAGGVWEGLLPSVAWCVSYRRLEAGGVWRALLSMEEDLMRCLTVAAVLALLAGAPYAGRAAPARTTPPSPGQQVVAATGTGATPDAARAAALRAAVARVADRLVAEKLRAQSAAVIEKAILARAGEFATVATAGSAGRKGAEHTFTGRFAVRVLPLAKALREYGLTPYWWVMVLVSETRLKQAPTDPVAGPELVRHLIDAGFLVLAEAEREDADEHPGARLTDAEAVRLASGEGAQIVLVGGAAADASSTPAVRGSGLFTAKGRVEVRAILTDTGKIVAAASADTPGADLSAEGAARKAIRQAAAKVAPELIASLLLVRPRTTKSVGLVVAGLKSFTQATELEQIISRLPSVRDLTRKSYQGGQLELDVDVAIEAAEGWGRELENPEITRPFTLTIDQVAYGRIRASLK